MIYAESRRKISNHISTVLSSYLRKLTMHEYHKYWV